ncbi:MAG TPA: dihydroorotate dehydrogenase-like protein [Ilumatobacteraceae bacterium]|nr:dihydroorotate dehydrogenase-like protein [Ilumatobacteraceae bacterium]
MPDLHTTYLGLSLRSPIVASAGPFTGDLDRLTELELAGVGAVVLPSIFEEQIEHETAEIDRLFTVHDDSFNEATSFFPEIDDYGSAIDSYLELIENAKVAVDVPVIASLNGANIGGWVKYARLLEDAGADALELNLYTVAADPAVDGSSLEAEHLELVALVAEEVDVPIAIKISPYYSSLANFVVAIQRAGADGVVMFNRFYSPDLDLETLEVEPRIALSTPEEVRLPLRWIGILRDHLSMSIAASTGVHTGFDAAKVILAGADVAMTTSSLLREGPSHVRTIEAQLIDWMNEHEYDSVAQMRGAVSSGGAADPAAYERANYIGNIATYTSRFMRGSVPLARNRTP